MVDWKMSGHTPGPWWIIGQPDQKKSQQVYSQNGTTGTAWGDTVDIRIANARLIAAAPELLELAQLVYNSFSGGLVMTFSDEDVKAFGSAIAKAKGLQG